MSTTVMRGNMLKSYLLGPSLTPTALTASTTTSQTFTVKGLLAADVVFVTYEGAQTAGVGIANTDVSANDTLRIVFSNSTSGTPTPAAGVYDVLVLRPESMPLPVSAV